MPSVLAPSVGQRERLRDLCVHQWADSKGEGWKGRVRCPRDGAEPWPAREGRDKRRSRQPEPSSTRDSCNGITAGRSRWALLESKPCSQRRACAPRERVCGDGSNLNVEAAEPARDSRPALSKRCSERGLSHLFPLRVCTRDKRERGWDPFV